LREVLPSHIGTDAGGGGGAEGLVSVPLITVPPQAVTVRSTRMMGESLNKTGKPFTGLQDSSGFTNSLPSNGSN
jgi:hypothetical protein